MNWRKPGGYVMTSDEGYRVSKAKVGGVVMYLGWAPDMGRAALEALMLVSYEIGQPVPDRCACLGVYASSAEACAVCDSHYQGVINAG